MNNYERMVIAWSCKTTWEARVVLKEARMYWATETSARHLLKPKFYREADIRSAKTLGRYRKKTIFGPVRVDAMRESFKMATGYLLLTSGVQNGPYVLIGGTLAVVFYALTLASVLGLSGS